MDGGHPDSLKANDQNRGIIAQSVSIAEKISIYDVFSKSEHHIILFWLSVTVLLLPLSDTIYLPAIHTIAVDLRTTDTLVSLTVSMYLLSGALSSLIWGVVSDRWGRKSTMQIGLFLFLLSTICCVFARNIFVLLFLRIFQGGSIAVGFVVGQAIIADIYPENQRGWATGIFFIPVLLGVLLGSAIGGILTYYFSWRSTFVFLSVFSLVSLVIYILIIPETHQYKVMKKLKDKILLEHNEIIEPSLSNPFLPLKFLTHLNLVPYILSASTAYASIIINQSLLAIILREQPYNFNELQTGLLSIPLGIGEIFGCLIGGYLADRGNDISKKKRSENRLIIGTIAYILIPIGLVIFGWAFQWKENVLIPITSAFLVAFAQSVYRPAVYSYLTLQEQQNAASVSGTNTSLNLILAGIGLSVSVPVIHIINLGPFFTLVAFINIVTILFTIILICKQLKPNDNDYQTI